MEAKGTHPILIYYDPLVFGGKRGKVGTVFREMVALSVHIRVDHTDGIMYLLIVLGVWGIATLVGTFCDRINLEGIASLGALGSGDPTSAYPRGVLTIIWFGLSSE